MRIPGRHAGHAHPSTGGGSCPIPARDGAKDRVPCEASHELREAIAITSAPSADDGGASENPLVIGRAEADVQQVTSGSLTHGRRIAQPSIVPMAPTLESSACPAHPHASINFLSLSQGVHP